MPTLYNVAIDTDNDGSFSNDAITDDVLTLEWRLGMAKPYAAIAAPSQAIITVRNKNNDYTELAPGTRVRIQSTVRFVTTTHFTGAIQHVLPTTGAHGKRTAKIVVQGRDAEIASQNIRLPVMVNARADEAIHAVLQQVTFRRPALTGYCIIDLDGYNAIGDEPTIFADDFITEVFDTGKSTFAYLGDTWADGITAAEAIRQLAESEGGRFFFDREGQAVFYNRHHTLTDASSATVFTDNMDGLKSVYGDEFVTRVEVQIKPRSIGSGNSLLWSLAEPLKIERGLLRTITAPYSIGYEEVGALDLIPLTAGVHYEANLEADGSGDDMTDVIRVILREQGGSAAVVEVYHQQQPTIYLTKLEIRGTPLHFGDAIVLTETDTIGTTFHGLRTQHHTLSAVSDAEEAAAAAQYIMSRHRAPRGLVRELQTNLTLNDSVIQVLTLLDRVTINEDHTNHSTTYRIIAEDHQVDLGGNRHRIRYLLEVDDREIFFIIGTHDIDDPELIVPR